MVGRARFFDVVQMVDSDGFVKKVASPEITVYDQGTTTPVSETLYAADTGGSTLTNPFTANSDGSVEFYMATAGRVSVKYDGTGAGLGTVTRNMEGVWPDPGSLNTTITSDNGDYTATISDAGVFTAPGLLRGGGVYRVHDEGMTYGTSSSLAAANKTAWENLIAKIAASDEPNADIYVEDDLPMDMGINLHHGLGSAKIINIVGRPGRGSFIWNGTAGPCLTVGGTSDDPLTLAGIYDVNHYFDDVMASGACILIGAYAGDFTIAGGAMKNSGSGVAALRGIDAAIGFTIRHYKIEVRNDTATLASGSLFPEGVRMNSAGGVTSGPHMLAVGIDGCVGRSYALRFANAKTAGAGLVDTPRLTDCIFKDHDICVLKNSGDGDVANLNAANVYWDGSNYGVFCEPITGASVYNWLVSNAWYAATKAGIWLSESNGGSVERMNFTQGTILNVDTAGIPAVFVGSGVKRFRLAHYDIDATGLNDSGDYGLNIGGTSSAISGAAILDNTVEVGGSASGAALVSSAATGTRVQNNTWVGVTATIGFSNGTGNNKDGNVFVSSL